jgi:formylglycine-generating enzyme required for sulfatase activity
MTTPAHFSVSVFQRFSFFHTHAFLGVVLAGLFAQMSPAETITDNFTDPANWGTPETDAGSIAIGSGRMNYTSASASGGFAGVARKTPLLPTNLDWSLKVDAHLNAFALTTEDQGCYVYLGVGKTGDWNNTHLTLEFGRGLWGLYNGFFIEDEVRINGASAPNLVSVPNLTLPDVALRMAYTAATQTLTYYYDANGATGGYNWVAQGSANIASGTYNLNLAPTDTLSVLLVGSSDLQTVAAGQAYLSNLEITVGQGATITSHPASQSIASGASATLSVTASGSGLTYQWYQGASGTTTTPVGTNSSSFTTPALTTTTSYWVRVTNTASSVNSNTATVTVASSIPLAAAIDQPTWTITSSGNLPWTGQATTTHDGVDVAKSGAITDRQTSEMSTTVTGPGMLSFWWKVSSETTYDFLRFHLDGVEQTGKISGTVDWTQKSYSLTAGSHTLKWAYTKDSSASSGDDCGWVDQVAFTPATPAPEIAVEQPVGTNLVDGTASVAYGSTNVGTTVGKTFIIKNLGNLDLIGLAITKDGANAADFTIGSLGATTLATGASTTFTVTFAPGTDGSKSAAIHLTSNDVDENPFDITLGGTGTAPLLAPGELVAPAVTISGGNVDFTVAKSVAGRSYQLQVSDTMAAGTWQDVGAVRVGDENSLVISVTYVPAVRQRFYRLALVGVSSVPAGFALIPSGAFEMGDQSNPLVGYSYELPVHTVIVSAFYMAKYETTKEEWDDVRTWGLANGYTDLAEGNGSYTSKGANHPVHSISWYDMVKWCNARSQKEGLTPCYTVSGAIHKTGNSDAVVSNWNANGYRLPTEAEWEKAARGGVAGKNFPWGTDTITHSQANYNVFSSNGTTNYYSYDVTPRPAGEVTYFFHPTYAVGGYPYSSPVGSFAPNGYGLYDMAGNMREWCWDWDGSYAAGSQTDPRGPSSGSYRMIRGGSWFYHDARDCRAASRHAADPTYAGDSVGFRTARSSVP